MTRYYENFGEAATPPRRSPPFTPRMRCSTSTASSRPAARRSKRLDEPATTRKPRAAGHLPHDDQQPGHRRKAGIPQQQVHLDRGDEQRDRRPPAAAGAGPRVRPAGQAGWRMADQEARRNRRQRTARTLQGDLPAAGPTTTSRRSETSPTPARSSCSRLPSARRSPTPTKTCLVSQSCLPPAPRKSGCRAGNTRRADRAPARKGPVAQALHGVGLAAPQIATVAEAGSACRRPPRAGSARRTPPRRPGGNRRSRRPNPAPRGPELRPFEVPPLTSTALRLPPAGTGKRVDLRKGQPHFHRRTRAADCRWSRTGPRTRGVEEFHQRSSIRPPSTTSSRR